MNMICKVNEQESVGSFLIQLYERVLEEQTTFKAAGIELASLQQERMIDFQAHGALCYQ